MDNLLATTLANVDQLLNTCKVVESTRKVVTVDTLCCDLDLNMCNILAVPWSNSVPNLSEIEQSAAELLRFEYLTL